MRIPRVISEGLDQVWPAEVDDGMPALPDPDRRGSDREAGPWTDRGVSEIDPPVEILDETGGD